MKFYKTVDDTTNTAMMQIMTMYMFEGVIQDQITFLSREKVCFMQRWNKW